MSLIFFLNIDICAYVQTCIRNQMDMLGKTVCWRSLSRSNSPNMLDLNYTLTPVDLLGICR